MDFVGPTRDELDVLGEQLGFSPLSLDDAFSGRQRAKIEHFDNHVFINAYAVRFDTDAGELVSDEIAIFLTRNALVTVRGDDGFDMSKVEARWADSSDLVSAGASHLLWGLLDVIVDGYFETVESLDVEMEKLEEAVFDEQSSARIEVQKRSYELRKSLVVLRRLTVPMREVINPLIRHDLKLINARMVPYFQDIYDHVIRVADWTESLRDLVTTLLETNLTIQGNRMNLIMKKVTSWAAIIAVPTAITGFYGQNIPYPGYMAEWGVWVSVGVTVLASIALYVVFRWRNWL
ncbi:MAG: magnesium transporter [Microbacteriaceae bacterium]|nr:magnesium transporter [Microbacteriaceae bacterium]